MGKVIHFQYDLDDPNWINWAIVIDDKVVESGNDPLSEIPDLIAFATKLATAKTG